MTLSVETGTAAERDQLRAELEEAVEGEVRFDSYTRAIYATDASIYQMDPVGVVLPRDAADVQAVIETCNRHGVAVLPRGGGTGLSALLA